jgi:tetratricopeptide (TPR) repeat protein
MEGGMKRWFWIWVPLLILVVGLLYGRSDQNARLPEEDLVVWSNSAVTGSDFLPLLWGRFYNAERDGFRQAVRPVATTALRWEMGLFHQNRGGFQWAQIILLAAAGMLFALLLDQTLRSRRLAALGGFLLALHPLATASVLTVAGVSDLLAMCFLLLSLWAGARFLGPEGHRGHLIVSAAALLLAIWSKEAALAGIAVLWATAAASRPRGAADRRSEERSPRWSWDEASWGLALASASAVVFMIVLIHRAGALGVLPEHLRLGRAAGVETGYSFARRVVLGLASIPTAVRLLFIPLGLGYSNDFLLSDGVALLPRAAIGGIILAGLTLLLVVSIRRRDELAFWVALVLCPLVGALGIFDPNGEPASPRLLFLVVPGLLGLVLCLSRRWAIRSSTRAGAIAAAALGLAFLSFWGARSFVRVADYRDWETLVRAQIRTIPESSLARFDLGNVYLSRRDWAPAQSEYDEALRLRPDFWMAYVNLGSAFFGKEDIGLAMRAFERALAGVEGKPEFATVEARADYNRALILMRQNRNAEAAKSLTRMLEIFPDHLLAHANLGFIYSNNPQYYEQAHYHLSRALELETDPERLQNLKDFIDRVEKRRQKEIRRREGIPADTSGGGVAPDLQGADSDSGAPSPTP